MNISEEIKMQLKQGQKVIKIGSFKVKIDDNIDKINKFIDSEDRLVDFVTLFNIISNEQIKELNIAYNKIVEALKFIDEIAKKHNNEAGSIICAFLINYMHDETCGPASLINEAISKDVLNVVSQLIDTDDSHK
jgi:DNA polymerase III alpha subunit (gram-positive type)